MFQQIANDAAMDGRDRRIFVFDSVCRKTVVNPAASFQTRHGTDRPADEACGEVGNRVVTILMVGDAPYEGEVTSPLVAFREPSNVEASARRLEVVDPQLSVAMV